MHEVEGEHSARHSEFRFMNRAIPLFPKETFVLKPGCKRYVKVIAPFLQELSGTAIVKIVQGDKTITLQCKLQRNLGTLDIVNTSDKPMKFNKKQCHGNSRHKISRLLQHQTQHPTIQPIYAASPV